jgi:hypothetical protein
MDKPKNKFWVALDGSYGFGVQTFNTDSWTEKDFDRIEEAHESDRLTIAQAVDAKRKKERMKAKRFIEQVQRIEVRHFFIDENGVVEIDPITGDEL